MAGGEGGSGRKGVYSTRREDPKGRNIATHALAPPTARRLLGRQKARGFRIIGYFFDVPVNDALARNQYANILRIGEVRQSIRCRPLWALQ